MTHTSESDFNHVIHQMLCHLGEDPERQGLRDTPERVSSSLLELTSGYRVSATDVIRECVFEAPSKDVVIQKNTEFYSLCEHHMLPFFGQVHLAYLPNEKIIGLSKIGRVIDIFAKRLQIQERLSEEIAEALWVALKPKGLIVIVEAQHFCMMMRGIKKQSGITITRATRGDLSSNPELRREITELLRL